MSELDRTSSQISDFQAAIDFAKEESRSMGKGTAGTEFLLLGLLGNRDFSSAKCLHKHGLDLKKAREEIKRLSGFGPGALRNEILLTPRTQRIVDSASPLAQSAGTGVDTIHLLISLLTERDGLAIRVLEALNIDIDALLADARASASKLEKQGNH